MEDSDFIVVGAGSAGCVVARRLIDRGYSVTLLEAGPANRRPELHVPALYSRIIGSRFTWAYETVPQPGAGGRRMPIPQGRTLGGGSSVNGMVYVRGQMADYDDWAKNGCAGWAWSDVLPYFKRSERNERLAEPLHGRDGPLSVSDPRHRHLLTSAFVEAGEQAGLPRSEDFNGPSQLGVGFFQITSDDGWRGSTARQFLRPVRRSPRLRLVTGAQAIRLETAEGRVRGVVVRRPDGSQHRYGCRRSVVLSAGTLGTPKILQLSGFGPAGVLLKHGIPVLRDIAGIGQNLQDHTNVPVLSSLGAPISLFGQDRPLRAIGHALRYALGRRGLLASNIIESGGFVLPDDEGRPTVQFHCTPALIRNALGYEGHGLTLHVCTLRPRSRGVTEIAGPDPAALPLIDTRVFSDPYDMDCTLRGITLAHRILAAPAMARHLGERRAPAADAGAEATLAHARATAKTVFHPVGTCRMGSDPAAVVDTRLKMRGVEGLHIADASVMPALVSGNTNAAAIMIGERCADFLAG